MITDPNAPTPETDALTWDAHCGDGDWGKVVYSHLSQKLERQRNTCREALLIIATQSSSWRMRKIATDALKEISPTIPQ
jgi:hypothetical protein